MGTFTIELPTMFGDHHVIAVRGLLLKLPGVDDVYASSSFQVVEVTFDESKLTVDDITTALGDAGYLGEFSLPTEADIPVNERNGDSSYFRHTEAYAQTRHVVSFAQEVPFAGRPLWPCPGMGPIKVPDEEVNNG